MKTPIIQGDMYIPQPYLPSLAPCTGLQKTYIKDLEWGSHHRDPYSLLRAITPSIRAMSTATVLQDNNKNAVKLQFHHHEEEDIHLAAGGIREGSVCIIKEPWFTLLAADSYGI